LGGGIAGAVDGSGFGIGWNYGAAAGLLVAAVIATAGFICVAAPSIAAFLGTSFTIGFGASVATVGGGAVAGATITVTGLEIVMGGVLVASGIIMFADTPKSNGYYGQRQVSDHTPKHVHMRGNGANIKIGVDLKPLSSKDTITAQMAKAIKKLEPHIIKLLNKW
jgi:hypothetical protein